MPKVNPLKAQKYLQQIDYPVNKEQLITHAQQQGADEEVISALSKFTNKTFFSPAEVTQTLMGQ
jgi:hypothetical protein